MCGDPGGWAMLSSQPLSPSSRLSDWIYIKVRFWPAAAPPCHHSRAWANNPTPGDVRSFEVNTGRRRRELEPELRPGFSLFVSLPGEWTNLIWYSIWHGGWKTCQYSTLYPLPSPPSLNNTSPHKTKTENIRYHLSKRNILFPVGIFCSGRKFIVWRG